MITITVNGKTAQATIADEVGIMSIAILEPI
jgi:hypothetical protein